MFTRCQARCEYEIVYILIRIEFWSWDNKEELPLYYYATLIVNQIIYK